MAEIITGDTTKGIKNVGELALRISKFDSYRLFTLYENVRERKLMNVSGDQRYYLVFKSPKKEIRIPEYDPKGFFEVDKVNGCILFKITKKNAEDILSMKTAGDKIFYIVRTFEERDSFGKVLNVTDEVEVYHGKWGDDLEFTTFTTENKVDLLTKSLAVQVDKNATQLNEYKDLLEKYNGEVEKISELEKELEIMRSERDELQMLLNEYTGSTYDGTLLSTDTKYIAFEDTLDNITFTEEQYQKALGELMTKGEVDFTEINDIDDSKINIFASINHQNSSKNLKMNIFKNESSTPMNDAFIKFELSDYEVSHGDKFKFILPSNRTFMSGNYKFKISLDYTFDGKKDYLKVTKEEKNGEFHLTVEMNFERTDSEGNKLYYAIGNIGTLKIITISSLDR